MLCSTNKKTNCTTFKNAIINPIPEDKGLWIPTRLPKIDLNRLNNKSSVQIATIILSKFLYKEINRNKIEEICKNSFNFDIPLVDFGDNKYILELTHGPTMAFKDVGARFTAFTTKALLKRHEIKPVLVATSGDTGGATASACQDAGLENIILYPDAGVSEFQTKQMVCCKPNILSLGIEGCFDDCQKAVKEILADGHCLSGNSINILRLISQITYYFFIWQQLPNESKTNFSVTVPSGNLGNAVAALMAKKMGLPIKNIIIAVNQNSSLDSVLSEKKYGYLGTATNPIEPSLSNAMDVALPNNLKRFLFYCPTFYSMIEHGVVVCKVSEQETIDTIKSIYNEYRYITDPHTAVAWFANQKYYRQSSAFITISTASPIKFHQTIKNILDIDLVEHANEIIYHYPNSERYTYLLGRQFGNGFNNKLSVSLLNFILKKSIIFYGMPGAGKSYLGKLLSDNFNVNFIDVDLAIQEHTKEPLNATIAKHGNEEFSNIEHNVFKEILSKNKERTIISTGGSVMTDIRNIKLTRNFINIWFNSSLESLETRLGKNNIELEERGVVMNPNENLEILKKNRDLLYVSCADLMIDTSNFFDAISSLTNLMTIYSS